MLAADTIAAELDAPFKLSSDQIEHFRTQGFVKLKEVLAPEVLEHYGQAITRKVLELNTLTKPMSQRSTYERAFLQIMNLWRQCQTAREFVFGKRLARIAAELMGVRGVRLYHDQALYKEPGGGITPWHADQFYWPLSSANTCTVWVPLQATPLEMGPLAFAAGSQTMEFGRDLAISDTSEQQLQAALEEAAFPVDETPFDLGEVSYHGGWSYHHAGANHSDRPRRVMTIIYMEDGIRLIEPRNRAHNVDWKAWMPGARVGEPVATELNPVLYAA
jgi:ectoine hydroxylase-related dioxygenase (phytanoyl-CoA dioxygenase family)